jgi:tRNA pseudouridine55 synthase
VVVNEWQVVARDGADLTVRITCGPGTYIRALARDLGRFTGSAAHLAELRRERSGPFDVAGAVTVDAVQNGDFTLAPLRDAIPTMATRILDAAELIRVGHGNAIEARGGESRVALMADEQTLIAIADRQGEQLRPKLVLRDG